MKKLGTPSPRHIGRPAGSTPQLDAVPEDRFKGTDTATVKALSDLVGADNVLHRISDLVRYASDASAYRLIPQVVVRPRDARDIAAVMQWANDNGRHIVFRSAGTSLNGQSITDDILMDLKTHFGGMRVLDGGERLWSRPGVILGDAQAVLSRHGYMIGADPGSTSVCTIGGVLADNSGGMRCSVDRDSYHTLEDATFVLPSGTIVDTTSPTADADLKAAVPQLYQGLVDIAERIRSDAELSAFLRKKFTIRNTNGLRLDAFLDEDSPTRMLMRLLVSSEGIFGAITESVIRTVKLPRHKAVAWVMLPSLRDAASYVHALVQAGAQACELLVAPVLRDAVGNFPAAKQHWSDLGDDAAALLLEVGGATEEELDEAIARTQSVLADAELLEPTVFDKTEKGMRGAWQIRSGLFGLFGAGRPDGSTYITEDVCFAPEDIGDASADLLNLLTEYDYPPLVMGHAAFGNLHFSMFPRLTEPEELEHYANFIDDLAELVIDKYHGSLKAEHGTGVNMAPYVRREWGDVAWNIMWELKNLIDPHGILAPEVKLTRTEDIHLKNFKSFPKVEKEINACVECGFCEPVCPSRHVTVTPRQRIVLRREMARQPEGSKVLHQLQEEFQYDAVDMCAADGTCAIPCPVSINTGKVMKDMRAHEHSDSAQKAGINAAKNYATLEKAARGAVKAAYAVQQLTGSKTLATVANAARSLINNDLLPTVPGDLPAAASRLPDTDRSGATAVYFPACINRIFGISAHAPADRVEVPEAIVALGRRSGRPVWIPGDVAGSCCGTPWSSKGYTEGFKEKAQEIAQDLISWTDNGTLPVVVDAASCTHGLLAEVPKALDGDLKQQFAAVRILDTIEWLDQEVMDYLPLTQPVQRVAVHPNCSVEHMGLTETMVSILDKVANEVVVPEGATCCGTAGDRGLLHPELVESATREQARSLEGVEFDAYVSDNRTCEMGLEMTLDLPYESIATVLERASRPVVSP